MSRDHRVDAPPLGSDRVGLKAAAAGGGAGGRWRGLGAVLLDPAVGDAELRARLLSTVPETQLREDQSDLANWTRGDRKARFEQTAERHAGLSQFAAPFLTRMKFVDEQGEGMSPTLSALRVYREHRAAGRRSLPPDAPLDFAPTALQPLIRSNGVTDRRRWESALFLKVRDEIQTGNLAIDGTGRWCGGSGRPETCSRGPTCATCTTSARREPIRGQTEVLTATGGSC